MDSLLKSRFFGLSDHRATYNDLYPEVANPYKDFKDRVAEMTEAEAEAFMVSLEARDAELKLERDTAASEEDADNQEHRDNKNFVKGFTWNTLVDNTDPQNPKLKPTETIQLLKKMAKIIKRTK